MADLRALVGRARRAVPVLKRRLFARTGLDLALHRLRHRDQPKFCCPVCAYSGPFAPKFGEAGQRDHAECPKCHALERHRLQYLVLQELRTEFDFGSMKMLHVAPEPFFGARFDEMFASRETLDLNRSDVDHQADLTALPFEDDTYDCVYASHVLEHILDDDAALREIRRVLRPGGIAVLPVPLSAEVTVEFPEPNPYVHDHVRSPGPDYFDRYEAHFEQVRRWSSPDFSEQSQVWVYEDRTKWPPPNVPLMYPMEGERFLDTVPVCM